MCSRFLQFWTDPWCLFDFFIVSMSLISLGPINLPARWQYASFWPAHSKKALTCREHDDDIHGIIMKIDTQCAAVPPRLPSLAPLRPHQVHSPGVFECIVRSVSSSLLTLLILSYPPSKLIFTSELFCLFIHARFSRYLAPALTCLCW